MLDVRSARLSHADHHIIKWIAYKGAARNVDMTERSFLTDCSPYVYGQRIIADEIVHSCKAVT